MDDLILCLVEARLHHLMGVCLVDKHYTLTGLLGDAGQGLLGRRLIRWWLG